MNQSLSVSKAARSLSDTTTTEPTVDPNFGTFDDEGNYTPREVVTNDLGMSFADLVDRILSSAQSRYANRATA